MKKSKGLTLLEIIVVIVIIGIIIILGISGYLKTIERSKDKEATASLDAISAGQRIYKLHYGYYYPGSSGPVVNNLAYINGNLGLNLIEQQWNFSITTVDSGQNYTGVAERRLATTSPYYRIWQRTNWDEEARCSGSGCP